MVDIPSTPSDGSVRVQWVPAIADTTAPTTTELNAAGAQDLSCYLTSDGWSPSLDEQVISDERLCTAATFERPGRHQRSLTVRYIENPGDITYNKAWVKLIPRTNGFFVVRRGPDYDVAFADDQDVQVWPVQMGQRGPLPPEANSVLKVEQKAHVTGIAQMEAVIGA